MSDHLALFLPLAPASVLVILALVLLVIHRMIASRRRLHIVGWVLLVVMLGTSTPLWPIPGLPRQSPPWSWSPYGGPELSMALDLGSPSAPARGALSLLLLLMGVFGCWSICRLPMGDDQARQRAAGLPGLLLVLAGGQLAVQGISPAAGMLGATLVLLGIWLLDLLSATRRSPIRNGAELALFMSPLAALGAAVLVDPTLSVTSVWWIIACGAIVLVGLMHGAIRGSPLLFAGAVQALGVTPLAVWLLIGFTLAHPARALIVDAAAIAGPILFGLGALNVAVSSSLRGLLYAQWVAQIGLLSLTIGTDELAPALGHVVVSSLLLSLMIGFLAEASASERIAELRPFPAPMRRQALAYALGAASACGLPLTLGYALRRAIVSDTATAFMAPLLLGGSTLMLGGLLQPLAALLRQARGADSTSQPRPEGTRPLGDGEHVTSPQVGEGLGAASPGGHNAGGGILLGLLLVLAAPYPLLWPLGEALLRRQEIGGLAVLLASHREALIMAGLQIMGALVLLGFANRGLRRIPAPVGFAGVIGAQERGWALPLDALAEVVAPLTPDFWLALGRKVLPRGGSRRRASAMAVLGAGVVLLIVTWSAWWRP